MDIEESDLIIRQLLHDEEYARKVIPFLKDEYFNLESHKAILQTVVEFYSKYGKKPTIESILIELQNLSSISEEVYQEAKQFIEDSSTEKQDPQYMLDMTEEYCRNKAVYNAITESIAIYDGTVDQPISAIPDLLSKALSVAFDNSIGHDFLDNAEDRWEFYHQKEKRYEFDLKLLNEITRSGNQIGIPSKSFSVIMGPTGGGKSAMLTHLTAAWIVKGYNVLYITLEMAEERIAERIDANLLNLSLDDVKEIPKTRYLKMLDKVKQKCSGKLIIKEYPTASAHVGHFRYLIKELLLKRQFKPDIVVVDYINICASSRVKNQNANSYTIVKSIAEELRGLAVEFDVSLWTATQVGRGGAGVSDVDLTDVSESWGLPATADLFLALIVTDELSDQGQIMIKQLKNRYGDINRFNKFILGFDKSRMKFFDIDLNSSMPSSEESPLKSKINSSESKKDKFREFKF